jgi:hypothetical protein
MTKLLLLAVLWLSVLPACPAQTSLLDRKVTLRYQNAPLEEVLQSIQIQGIPLSYSKDLLPVHDRITLTSLQQPVGDVLRILFKGKNILFREIGGQLVLRPEAAPAAGLQSIRGVVRDRATQAALASASVVLKGSTLGTVTNAEGVFSLKIPTDLATRSLVISHLGYQTVDRFIDQKGEPAWQLELEPAAQVLNEVVIHKQTGRSLLDEALSRIAQNYDTTAIRYTYYLRDETWRDAEPIQALEAVHQAYEGSSVGPPVRQVRLVKGRKSRRYAVYQQILSTFPHLTGFDIGLNANVVFDLDWVRQRPDKSLLGAKGLEQHQFELLGLSQYEGREVYVMAFDQKDRYRNRALMKGKIYLDSQSLAFVRIEAALSPKGIRHASFLGASRPVAQLLGFGRCTVEGQAIVMTYRPVGSKWYLSTVENSGSLKLLKSKRNYQAQVQHRGKLVVTDFQREDAVPFEDDQLMQPTDLMYRRFGKYDASFWKEQNIIEPDPKFEASFSAIEQRQMQEGFDEKFWRRFKGYENPASQDSLHSGKDQIRADPAKTHFQKPRFESFSRSFYTPHFAFYHLPADSLVAQTMARTLEDHYARIVSDMGVRQQPRITVEVYPDTEAYHFAINRPDASDWDVGSASGSEAFRVVSPRNPGKFHTAESLMKAALHEFTHCVHYRLLEELSEMDQQKVQTTEAPWLFEAIACYEAGMFYEPGCFDYLRAGQYPTLAELNRVEDHGKVYDVGYVLIDYILHTWDRKALVQLLRTNGDIPAVLQTSVADFEQGWHADLRKKCTR